MNLFFDSPITSNPRSFDFLNKLLAGTYVFPTVVFGYNQFLDS